MKTKQTLKSILVLTDGSSPSLVGQELTAFLAKRLDSKVTVIHVVSHEMMNPRMHRVFVDSEFAPAGVLGAPYSLPPEVRVPEPKPTPSLDEKAIAEVTEWYHQRGEEAVSDAVALFKEEGVQVNSKLVEHADPAETILREIEKESYDLVVMGSTGEDEKDPHLGSVARKVLQHSKAPVLIARKKTQASKILVPVDGSENSLKALQFAALIAEKTGAPVTLLYVQEHGLHKLKPELSEKIGNRILSTAAKQATGIKVDQKLETGDPAKTIIQTADEGNHDLIIMGSKGHNVVSRFLLGSVSDHIANYARYSVIITK